MEKRTFGIIMICLGVLVFAVATVFLNLRHTSDNRVFLTALYGVLSATFVFAGIGLMRKHDDVIKR